MTHVLATHVLSLVAVGLSITSIAVSLWKTVRMWAAQRRLRVELLKLRDAQGSDEAASQFVQMFLQFSQMRRGYQLPGTLCTRFAEAIKAAMDKLGPRDQQVLERLVREPIETQARVAFRLAAPDEVQIAERRAG